LKRLGKATCKICGGKTRLIVHKRGLFSECRRCKDVDWVWQPGDSYDQIRRLAKRFSVPLSVLLGTMEKSWDPPSGKTSMEIVFGYEFNSVFQYAVSGGGMIALNGKARNLEEKIERVLAHEVVHLTLENMFQNAPLNYLLKAQKMWDLTDNPEAKGYYEWKYGEIERGRE